MKSKNGKQLFNKFFLSAGFVIIASILFYSQLSKSGYLPSANDLVDILCLNECEASAAMPSHIVPEGDRLLNGDRTIFQILNSETINKNKTSILIEKSRYRLTVYLDKKPLKSYAVVFGENPVDDKLREGDRRTPEGIFKIKELYPHPDWSKFLWLDYPTKDSWKKHINAKIKGIINWTDTVGSEIGIHGVPTGGDRLIDDRSNWTWGCISLKTKDIDEIYQIVQQGTEVEIIP